MVKHVILWTLKEELSKEEKETVEQEIKAGLEGLAGQIPGLVDIQVNIHGLASSNADLMLDSSFETEEALKGYSVHPAMWQWQMAKCGHTQPAECVWIMRFRGGGTG